MTNERNESMILEVQLHFSIRNVLKRNVSSTKVTNERNTLRIEIVRLSGLDDDERKEKS